MENKCPKCGEDYYYRDDTGTEQDGDILWVDHWCKCGSCGQRWKYVEKFTFEDAWVDIEEEN